MINPSIIFSINRLVVWSIKSQKTVSISAQDDILKHIHFTVTAISQSLIFLLRLTILTDRTLIPPQKTTHDQTHTNEFHTGSKLEGICQTKTEMGQIFLGIGSIHCLAKTAICA